MLVLQSYSKCGGGVASFRSSKNINNIRSEVTGNLETETPLTGKVEAGATGRNTKSQHYLWASAKWKPPSRTSVACVEVGNSSSSA